MIEIIAEMRKEAPQKVGAAGNMPSAKEAIKVLTESWKASKKGRSVKWLGMEALLYWSDGKLAGMIYPDPVPQREPVESKKGGAK